jgi:hypothetical protein
VVISGVAIQEDALWRSTYTYCSIHDEKKDTHITHTDQNTKELTL